MKVFIFLYGLVAFVTSPALAEAPAMVEMEATFLRANSSEMSAALALAGAGSGVLSSEELGKTLAALKQAGATVFGNPRSVTISGTRARVQAGREFPYPAAYSTDEKSPGKRYPASFESRNLGLEVEFEPKAISNDRIDFLIEPAVTTFLGFVDYSETAEKPPGGNSTDDLMKSALKEGGIWRPVFSSFRVSSQLNLASGQTTLLGGVAEEVSSASALSRGLVKKTDERLIYVFITVRILKNP